MHPVLRLYEDVLSDSGALTLAAAPRMIFVAHGSVTIEDRTFGDNEAWYGESAVTVTPGKTGVTCWRWEIGERSADMSPGASSQEKLAALLDPPEGDLLWRGDSVAFPPGGVAYLHRHQGPGIRCVAEGAIRVDTKGHSTSYGPGGAWFEAGPDPVFAQAAADRATRFIRVMILPRALVGKSSIQYANEDDKTKPKTQQYKVYVDAPLTRSW